MLQEPAGYVNRVHALRNAHSAQRSRAMFRSSKQRRAVAVAKQEVGLEQQHTDSGTSTNSCTNDQQSNESQKERQDKTEGDSLLSWNSLKRKLSFKKDKSTGD